MAGEANISISKCKAPLGANLGAAQLYQRTMSRRLRMVYDEAIEYEPVGVIGKTIGATDGQVPQAGQIWYRVAEKRFLLAGQR